MEEAKRQWSVNRDQFKQELICELFESCCGVTDSLKWHIEGKERFCVGLDKARLERAEAVMKKAREYLA